MSTASSSVSSAGPGGITDALPAMEAALKKRTGSEVVYDSDPERLIDQLLTCHHRHIRAHAIRLPSRLEPAPSTADETAESSCAAAPFCASCRAPIRQPPCQPRWPSVNGLGIVAMSLEGGGFVEPFNVVDELDVRGDIRAARREIWRIVAAVCHQSRITLPETMPYLVRKKGLER